MSISRTIATGTLAAFAVTAMLAVTPIAPAHAQDAAAPSTELVGDPKKGKRVFNRCRACHTVKEGDPNRVGPNLFGIVGAPLGRHEDYTYSANLLELKAEGRVWDDATLDGYLKNPKSLIPGGIMSFAGLAKDSDRAHVIAYLATFGAPAE